MDEHILPFVSALRAAGVRVSPPEAAEALVAAGSVELDDRHTFRAALRSTLVKRSLDLDVFEQLFELYFSPYGSRSGQIPEVDPQEDLPALRAVLVLRHRGDSLAELLSSDDRVVTFFIDAPTPESLDALEEQVRAAITISTHR